MNQYIKSMVPSLAVTIGLFILPIVLSIYYVVTAYSGQFVTEQSINYFDVQGNLLGKALLDQSWISWFNRFMDFAIWGIIAAIVLVVIWMVSAARVATKNHYAEEEFRNFRGTSQSWHSHFFVVAIIRLILVAIIIYSVLAILGKSIPQLETTISLVLQSFSWSGMKDAVLAALSMVLLQFMVVASVKTFKHLSLD